MEPLTCGIAGDILDRLSLAFSTIHDPCCREGKYHLRWQYHQAVIEIHRDEVLYDVANIAYVEGDVAEKEGSHSIHQVQDIIEDGNRDRVSRVADLAIAKCVELLYPYSRVPVEEFESRDNLPVDSDSWDIWLNLPGDVSGTTVTYIARLVHEYLVCRILWDWLSITHITNKDSASMWRVKLEEIEEEIKNSVMSRYRRLRRKMNPF